ncbi:MAG: ABC transporter substrate-binding protein [Methylophilales bacterium]|nr:ABC transporter substrate-binding protein [Methylophilales bacterium]
MKIFRLFLAVLLLSVTVLHAEGLQTSPPDEVVKKTVDDVLSALTADKELTKDAKKTDDLVNTKILPRFDFERMARVIVGENQWSLASAQEQSDLVNEYRTFLTHIFTKSLAQYSDEKVTFLPLDTATENEAIVKCKVIDPTDGPSMVDIKVTKNAAGWQVYDIEWGGVSLSRTYKSNFKSILQQGGVANLASALRKKNQDNKLAGN